MEIICPKCNRSANVDDTFAGKSVKCACGERFIAPIIKESVPESVQVQKAVTTSPIRKTTMDCPKCGYQMDAFALECPRCSKVNEQKIRFPSEDGQFPHEQMNNRDFPNGLKHSKTSNGFAIYSGITSILLITMLMWGLFLRHKTSTSPLPTALNPTNKFVSLQQQSAQPSDSTTPSTSVNSPTQAQTPVPDVNSSTPVKIQIAESQKDSTISAQKPAPALQGALQGQVFIVTKGRENIKLGLTTVNLYSYNDIVAYLTKRKPEYAALQDRENQLVGAAEAAVNSAKQSVDNAQQKSSNAINAIHRGDPNFDKQIEASNQALDENDQALNAYSSALIDAAGAEEHRDVALTGGFFFENLPNPIATTQTDANGEFSLQIPTDGQYVIGAQAQRDVGGSTEYYYWMIQVSLNGAPNKSIMMSNNNLSTAQSPDSLIDTAY